MGTSRRRLFYWRRWHSLNVGDLEYLTRLASIYDVDPFTLLNSFIEAEKKKTVICGPLKIMRRERAKDYAIFLLTNESNIIAQIKLENAVWENPAQAKELCSLLAPNRPEKTASKPPSSVKELRNGMKNINLRVMVAEKSEVMEKHSPYDRSSLRLCIAIVTDSSGSIRLPLWNDQINAVSVGDQIDIKHASVKMFQGALQIVPNRKSGELVIIKKGDY